MGREKPCCAAAAARAVRKLDVGGSQVGFSELDAILEDAHRRLPAPDGELRAALLERARIYNSIPPQAEEEYAEALLREFKRTYPEEGSD